MRLIWAWKKPCAVICNYYSNPVTNQDRLYAQNRKLVEAFRFDNHVAAVFDDMIRRSVPGYPMMLELLGVLAGQTVSRQQLCYDLGCSLGASTLAIRHNIAADNRIIAIDNSQAMLERCRQVVANDPSPAAVDIIEQDIMQTVFQPCQLVSMNLTLQFVARQNRLALLTAIADALQPGGVLFLSEKLQFANSLHQTRLTDLHHQFKKHQGYSDLEIAQKRTAIENVLIPETLQQHTDRLLQAGFSDVLPALQCFNFVTLIAYK